MLLNADAGMPPLPANSEAGVEDPNVLHAEEHQMHACRANPNKCQRDPSGMQIQRYTIRRQAIARVRADLAKRAGLEPTANEDALSLASVSC